jgi:hypothetical protein
MENEIKFIRDYIDKNSEYGKVFLCSSAIKSAEDWQENMGDEVIGSSIHGLIVEKENGRAYDVVSFNRLLSDPECKKYGVPYDHDKTFHLVVIAEEESGNYDYYVMSTITETLRVKSLTIMISNILI